MNRMIVFRFGSINIEAELYDNPVATAIWSKLPMESIANLWGKEIYFETKVSVPLTENATKEVQAGDIGYWSIGRAICIFFGPTPLSKGNEIVPASPVDLIGKIKSDMKILNQIEDREIVLINRV